MCVCVCVCVWFCVCSKHTLFRCIVPLFNVMYICLAHTKYKVHISYTHSANIYNIEPHSVFLIHDDLDLKLGKCTLKQGGSAR